MKKNVMMRLASGLLVAVLLTTCAISGTFAKYVTSGSANDSARVAKFGVTVAASGAELFANEYDGTISGKTVVGVGGDKVVAPGTSGEFVSLGITGIPEVAVEVAYTANVTLNNKWIGYDTKFYCPIVVTIASDDGAAPQVFCGLAYDDAATFEAAIENALGVYTKQYAPHTDLNAVGNDYLKISWGWAFENASHACAQSHGANPQEDVDDTLLGDRAANNVLDAGTIAVEVTATVTQID